MSEQNVEAVVVWVLDHLHGVPDELLFLAVRYIIRTYRPLDRQKVESVVTKAMSKKEREMLSKAAREWLAEGEARGVRIGQARGVRIGQARGVRIGQARGKAKALLVVLEQRFGPLPRSVHKRLASAEDGQLDAWLSRAVHAASLGAVFDRIERH